MLLTAPRSTGAIDVKGRRVGWAEWGAPDGKPVLFCSGAAMSSSLGFGAEALDELGMRLVCVDRAGIGRSAPDPDKSLESYARDVSAVLETLRIEQPAVVGFSQGAPFAVALGCARVVGSLALVSAQDELAHPSIRPLLAPQVAELVETIERDRAGFEAAFAARIDAEGLWELVVGSSSPHDRALYESGEFAAAYRRSLQEGLAQGPAGYVRDLTLAMSRWSTPPEGVDPPVHLWYGQLDTSPVHSPDWGVTTSQRFPNATLHVLPEEGSSLLWTRSGEILRELAP